MLINPYRYTVAVGGGYFFEERFEGSGYQNTWTESGTGTINEDYTTSPLEGSQSLLISGTTQNPRTTTVFVSDQSELWAFFRLRIDTTVTTNRAVFHTTDNASSFTGGVTLNTNNTLKATNGSTNSGVTTGALTVGSNYNVWFHWIKGTGSDGFASVGVSTGTTEVTSGGNFSSLSNGNATLNTHGIQLGFSANTTGAFVIDQILVSTSGTIGNNPA